MLLPKVAQVAVEQASFHFDKLYHYTVPISFGEIKKGTRVIVPFGGGNKRRQGIIVAYDVTNDYNKLKPIYSVLDKEPLLDDEMMELALWLKERTFCTVFDAVRAMLPTGLYMRITPLYRVAASAQETDQLPEEEKRIIQLLSPFSGGVEKDKILSLAGYSRESDLVERLTKRGVLQMDESVKRTVGDATMKMVRLLVEDEQLAEAISANHCTDKQKSVIHLLQDVGAASVKELCYFCSVTNAVVTALEKKQIIEIYDSEILRSPYTVQNIPLQRAPVLNEEQQRVFKGISDLYHQDQPACALLHGITGSGKTQVYMNLIETVINDGKQVIVLVPEISLTPQIMNLFINRFGKKVAVLHSALAIGERLDEWKRIKNGDAQIVVGTRSAVFAPCSNLGLIVMDEEQEHTYKSESAPRYHARDVARYRCVHHKALLLLTSATPSVESYYAAVTGRYQLFSMMNRFGDAQLPSVQIVDMRAEENEGSLFGETLIGAVRECLAHQQQAILLLNRRGYNTFISCRSCGHVLACPSCSISMTYHRANNRMMCHYCGATQKPITVCPECGSDKIRYSGQGTQRVEQELAELFPEASVLRMDTDTTMSRSSYEKKFKEFGDGKYQIMIGTQMVAKGLDFPNVGLVGVLTADQSLYSDDYRAYETTFSLLTQVVGRAGRHDVPGKAIIQTYTPENYVINLAAKQDYEAFFKTEIAARKAMKYPPFTEICQFAFIGLQEEHVKTAAKEFLQYLHSLATNEFKDIPMIALDPTPAVISRVAGKYRYKLLIKIVNNAKTRAMIGRILTEFCRQKPFQKITITADLSPAGML